MLRDTAVFEAQVLGIFVDLGSKHCPGRIRLGCRLASRRVGWECQIRTKIRSEYHPFMTVLFTADRISSCVIPSLKQASIAILRLRSAVDSPGLTGPFVSSSSVVGK